MAKPKKHFGTRHAFLPDFEGKPDGLDQITEWPNQTTHDIGSTWPKGATFTDTIAYNLDRNTGIDTKWLSFYQEWHVIITPNIFGFTANTHKVKVTQKKSYRSIP